jgi:hypothetical protein
MNLKRIEYLGYATLLTLFLVVVSGCKGPVPWNVNINLKAVGAIPVDIIGISPSEKDYWEHIKPDDYWAYGSKIRKDVENRMVSFNFQDGTTAGLKMDDPIWQTWFNSGATELMIMARLPGTSFDNSPYDGRRQFLLLNKGSWRASDRTLEIEVQDAQIHVKTAQRSRN